MSIARFTITTHSEKQFNELWERLVGLELNMTDVVIENLSTDITYLTSPETKMFIETKSKGPAINRGKGKARKWQ